MRLKCYFVTLLPRPFLQQHKRAERIVKVRKNQLYIEPDPKTIREKWHMMTMTITITIGMRPQFPPILRSILQIAKQFGDQQPHTFRC